MSFTPYRQYFSHKTAENIYNKNINCGLRYLYGTGGAKSSFNRESNQGPLVYRASALPTELLRSDILTDSHIPGYPVTYMFNN